MGKEVKHYDNSIRRLVYLSRTDNISKQAMRQAPNHIVAVIRNSFVHLSPWPTTTMDG